MKIFKNKLSILIALVLLAAGTLAVGNKNLFIAAAQDDLFVTLGGNKTQVTPGESLQYVVTVRDDGQQNLTNIYLQQNFRPQVTYVTGSTQLEKNNNTISVTDAWTTDGANIGTLTPGQTAYFKFNGKIDSNASVGSSILNAIQIKSDQTTLEAVSFTVTVVSPNQSAVLRSGDFLKVTNNTLQNGWQNGVSAGTSDVVEFLVKISNDGQNDARNVHVFANLPSSPANPQNPSVTLSADNAPSVTDSVTVNGTLPFWFVFRVGHGTFFGVNDLFNCPNGCPMNESFFESPLNIGTVKPGESMSLQMTFKADIFTPSSPTPTPTVTPTPTATPTSSPTATPGQNGQFMLCKFEDKNGNGIQDNDENGLSWQFNYSVNGAPQISYQTTVTWWQFWNKQGCGPVITLPGGSSVQAQEADVQGWTHTTSNQMTFTIPVNSLVVEKFGNQQTVTPTPTPTPTATPTTLPSSPTSSCSALSATTTSGTAPLTVTFTGNGSDSAGNLQQYQFNFGDNSNGQNQIVTTDQNQASHIYYNSGNFTANLIVKDSRGNWVGGGNNCQLNINVNSKPQVLGATAPPVLPKTGSNDGFYMAVASIPTGLVGIYLYRRFRLI